MIPSFLTWLESDENPALGRPMHKQTDVKSTLESEIKERMLKMTQELMNGSRSEQDILRAVQDYVNKRIPQQEPSSPQAPDQQANEINPVAQGPAPGNF